MIEHLTEFTKIEISDNESDNSNTDNNKLIITLTAFIISAVNSLFFFSNLSTLISTLNFQIFKNITESVNKSQQNHFQIYLDINNCIDFQIYDIELL